MDSNNGHLLIAYTDGSTYPENPGAGGWSYVLFDNGVEVHRDFGSEHRSTNNRMELIPVIKCFEYVRAQYPNVPLHVISDSLYVVKGVNYWVDNWVSDPESLAEKKNMDLWMYVYYLKKDVGLYLGWVRGHDGDYWNEVVDSMANAEARNKFLSIDDDSHRFLALDPKDNPPFDVQAALSKIRVLNRGRHKNLQYREWLKKKKFKKVKGDMMLF